MSPGGSSAAQAVELHWPAAGGGVNSSTYSVNTTPGAALLPGDAIGDLFVPSGAPAGIAVIEVHHWQSGSTPGWTASDVVKIPSNSKWLSRNAAYGTFGDSEIVRKP